MADYAELVEHRIRWGGIPPGDFVVPESPGTLEGVSFLDFDGVLNFLGDLRTAESARARWVLFFGERADSARSVTSYPSSDIHKVRDPEALIVDAPKSPFLRSAGMLIDLGIKKPVSEMVRNLMGSLTASAVAEWSEADLHRWRQLVRVIWWGTGDEPSLISDEMLATGGPLNLDSEVELGRHLDRLIPREDRPPEMTNLLINHLLVGAGDPIHRERTAWEALLNAPDYLALT